jgi:hypothetical protein
MAPETKMIVKLIAQQIARCQTVKEAYNAVRSAVNVEGIELPSYDEYKEEIKKDQ